MVIAAQHREAIGGRMRNQRMSLLV